MSTQKLGDEIRRQADGVRFSRRPETAHVECHRILQDDKDYVKKITKNRTTLVVRNISMTCDELRRRIVPSKKLHPLRFGVAHARIVYESYEFIEDELRSSYHPQNVFCYSVDRKANENFNNHINALAKCFPNVVVTKARFNIDSSGHFMNHAYYECLKLLADKPGWGYLLLMQNYDVMIKTVYETVAILEKLEGANDVHIRPCEAGRWNHSFKWDARSLRLYRDERLATPAQLNGSLTFARGAVHASLSRAAVHWMVKIVDLTVLLDQLNIKAHGIDEVLIPTLQVSEIFDMPGRFTAECVKGGHINGFITRIELWGGNKMCQSKKFRHAVCIYGIEDFSWLSRHPKIIANKAGMPVVNQLLRSDGATYEEISKDL
ncbi:Core-2/I-Branching enzyme [Ancylostoma duodenale]|uniref:Core-2/I-Branching enzyme n=1 Tax=Ancylostoma duodenale TaxID=51022 RepID=A0A0C2GCY0_9BILA|nr:Core-2/I-Branching enzyme [Ancylostoma duodenale]